MSKKESLEKWHNTMSKLELLTRLAKDLEESLNPLLLQNIVAVAFKNPLLREVTIDDTSCIAHTIIGLDDIRFARMDNPLEEAASEGSHRIRFVAKRNILIVERNTGSQPMLGSKPKRGPVDVIFLQTLKRLEIIKRDGDLWHETPTFDLVLST